MKRRKVRYHRREMSNDELGRLVMQNLANSMNACFSDTSGVEALAAEEEAAYVPQGFTQSPEYAAALAAYKLRLEKGK